MGHVLERLRACTIWELKLNNQADMMCSVILALSVYLIGPGTWHWIYLIEPQEEAFKKGLIHRIVRVKVVVMPWDRWFSGFESSILCALSGNIWSLSWHGEQQCILCGCGKGQVACMVWWGLTPLTLCGKEMSCPLDYDNSTVVDDILISLKQEKLKWETCLCCARSSTFTPYLLPVEGHQGHTSPQSPYILLGTGPS